MGAKICVLLYFLAELLWVFFSVQIDVRYFKSMQGIVKMNQRKKMYFSNRNSLPFKCQANFKPGNFRLLGKAHCFLSNSRHIFRHKH